MRPSMNLALSLSLLLVSAAALQLDLTSEDSFKTASSDTVWQMMTYYHGNETGQIPGAFPTKWWEGAALFLALLQYQHFTGDTTYNDELSIGLQWQSGSDGDYMPSNYSSYLGNDDQMFWGLAAMLAAEVKFPDRPSGFSWLSLAQGVFNTQTARWDTTSCGGGMRWQIYIYQVGYNMKNSISNGGLFQLSARLARYTGEQKYADWANKIWDWVESTPLLNNQTWHVADSTNPPDCTNQGDGQYSYNYGTFMMGAAYMYNITTGATQQMWLTRVNGLLGVLLDEFFPEKNGGIFEEVSCEPIEDCNNNAVLFKGVTSQWLSFTALLVPSTYNTIMPKLQTTASAVAEACTGNNDNVCGVQWYTKKYDNHPGMEQQISASDLLVANMIKFDAAGSNPGPVTAKTGGNSTSDPNAGQSEINQAAGKSDPITMGDRVGAGFITVLILGVSLGAMGWMIHGT